MKNIQIAIDGPAGAGKSSIAKEIAKEFKYIYIDTGAMYRALTLIVMERNISFEKYDIIEKIAQEIEISFQIKKDRQEVFVGGRNVTEEIRSPEISNNVSTISAISGVRKQMVKKQQDLAQEANVVMDGRDIGTVVLPGADLKIFLTATPEERAKRRKKEMDEKGHKIDFEKLLKEIKDRDHLDETRDDSPLIAAKDAILVDTTDLSFDQVLNKIINLIRGKINVL